MCQFMADIRTSLSDALRAALVAGGIDLPGDFQVGLERPARREHGDWSSNAALAIAKGAGRNPRELAEELVAWLEQNRPEHVAEVSVAGPGFVNFKLAPSWLHSVVLDAVAAGTEDYGRQNLGQGCTVIVEFVSANPTGPVHAGHGRGAAYGDAVARLLEWCGYDVQREFYINDRGTQMDLYAASLAAVRADEPVPEDGYNGQYIVEWAAEMPVDADARQWGRERALPISGRYWVRWRWRSTRGRASRSWWIRGSLSTRWPPLTPLGPPTRPKGRCGCVPATTATTRIGC